MVEFKKIFQLFHWGPVLALSVIFCIACTTVMCDLMWWPPDTPGAIINLIVFLTWIVLTLYNYFQAAFQGPGFVPEGWAPENEAYTKYLQYCEMCQGYKSPRSHHCRKCDRCVIKMDHHCPWINTCCGHFNHGYFTLFLFFAPCGCIHATFILIASIIKAFNRNYYYHYGGGQPMVILDVWGIIACMFSIGLALGVTIAVGMLFIVQFNSILKNETGIESWIITKAKDREREEEEGDFIYPYHLGWKRNLWQVYPYSGKPLSDGFTWEVVDGCGQYTLSVEQINQKAEKRERSIMYNIASSYSGTWFPITKGCKVCCCIPCTDEPRIRVKPGDQVIVTRWKRHWLYGRKVMVNDKGKKRVRGWFPRKCAIDIMNGDIRNSDNSQSKKTE